MYPVARYYSFSSTLIPFNFAICAGLARIETSIEVNLLNWLIWVVQLLSSIASYYEYGRPLAARSHSLARRDGDIRVAPAAAKRRRRKRAAAEKVSPTVASGGDGGGGRESSSSSSMAMVIKKRSDLSLKSFVFVCSRFRNSTLLEMTPQLWI